MPRSVELAIAWPFFFAICFAGAFHRGFDAELAYDPGSPPENQTIRLGASAAEVTARYGGGSAGRYRGGDLASYLAGGERLLEAGDVEKQYADVWPPGMAVVAAIVLAVSGPEAYPLKMVLVSVFCWSIAMLIAFALLQPFAHRLLDFAAIAALFLLPALRGWTFGFGALLSESISNALFLISLCVLISAITSRRVSTFAIAGGVLGAATLVRAYFDYVGTFTLGVAALGLSIAAIVSLVRGGRSVRGSIGELLRQLHPRAEARSFIASLTACWLAAFIAFFSVTVPWRVYKTARWATPSLVSIAPGSTFLNAWKPEDRQPVFVKGAAAACQTDPRLCEVVQRHHDVLGARLRQKMALMTFVFRPGPWVKYKLSHFDWWWFGRDWASLWRDPYLLIEGLLLLALGVAGVVLLVLELYKHRNVELSQLAWFTSGFVFWNTVLFIFLQFEWRYSLSPRLFAYFLPLLLLSLRQRSNSI